MGHSYFATPRERKEYNQFWANKAAADAATVAEKRRELAAKIVMATVDRVVNQIIRPGPKPEERECYEMAGELRAIVPELEELAKQIIDVNDGID
jgi:hypothetical protein